MNLRKDGTAFPVDVHETAFTYQGNPACWRWYAMSPSGFEAEEQLREKEAQYRNIFEAS